MGFKNGVVVLLLRIMSNSKILLFVFANTISSLAYAGDLGVTSSGKDISLTWLQSVEVSSWGFYLKGILDSEKYQNGSLVSVCNDGSISGSIGSGTCSNHGGMSYGREAQFGRDALVIGSTFQMNKNIQFQGGIIAGMYSSDINIGDKSKLNFIKYGIDVGLSYKVFNDSNFKLQFFHETEQQRNSIGMSISL